MNKEGKKKFLKKVENEILHKYKYWIAILDIKQYYLGRIFLFAKRLSATDMISLNLKEREELWVILKKIKKIYAKTFKPDKLNFAFLGNELEHCHCHIIPRYIKKRTFNKITFKDENYGHNYSRPNTKLFKIDDETYNKIFLYLKRYFK
jgi:diadenosine tetraphosphate (Ap4A) HIT family hydrolase